MNRTWRMLVAASLLLVTVGCGTEQVAAQNAGGASLSIISPAEGTSVTLPFTVELQSGVPLGEPETGQHHVHVFFDGNDSEYLLAYGDSIEVTEFPADLPPGPHVLNASLRHADHSAAGVEAQVPVVVEAGGAPAPAPAPGGSDGY